MTNPFFNRFFRHSLRLLIGMFVICWASTAAAQAETRPNVLFIAVDDLNDFPKCMNRYPDAITPSIDALAQRGILFTDAHSQYTVCAPSRASVITGLYPKKVVLPKEKKDRQIIDTARKLGVVPLYEAFAQQGYKTMAVGKIMHTHVPKGSVDESGGRGSFLPNKRLGLNWKNKDTLTDWGVVDVPEEQMPDHIATDWAVQRLQQTQDKPFLLMVGLLRPHNPWYVPQRWFDLYPDVSKITLPPFKEEDMDDLPAKAKKFLLPQMPRTTWARENKQWGKLVQSYLASISFADHQVGRILDALDKSPHAKNTIVILWSDHGYHMGEKNTFQKHTLWERSTHVPLIFAGPGIPANARCARPVGLIDIYPTLHDLCQLDVKTPFDGRSLKPLLHDPDQKWEHPVYCAFSSAQALITKQWHYIRYRDGSEELYDRQKDPQQWGNLAARSDTRETRERLKKMFPKM